MSAQTWVPIFLVISFLLEPTICKPRILSKEIITTNSFDSGVTRATAHLINSLNFSADPCENFFEYVCGNWVVNHQIPNDQISTSQLTLIREKVVVEKRELLEDELMTTSKAIELSKRMYNKCMDTDRLDKVGATELLETIRKFSKWPLVFDDVVSEVDLTDLLIHTTYYRDVSVFFDYGASEDNKNVSRRILEFDQGTLGLGSSTIDYYLNSKKFERQLTAYKKQLIDRIKFMKQDAGICVNEEKIAEDVEEIVNFETEWAKILVKEEERRNQTATYNLIPLEKLQNIMPMIDWKRYVIQTTPLEVHDYVNDNPKVVVTNLQYFEKLSALLRSTEPRILVNYVLLRYSGSWLTELGNRYLNSFQKFAFAMYGRNERQPRWKECANLVSSKMQHAVGALYARKYFNAEAKAVLLSLVGDLRKETDRLMKENDWMDDETKKNALQKAANMMQQVAFPDYYLRDETLDEHYAGLASSSDESLSQLVEKAVRWSTERSAKKLLEPVDREEFTVSADTVNAFYAHTKNTFIFPAAILQAPLFDVKFPVPLNYGGIGSIIGHEITHGFDDNGRQFNADGNLHDWWKSETEKHFSNKAQCMIEQFSKIEVPGTGLHINGKLTQGENIADLGGLKLAHMAYKRHIEQNGEQPALPGFDQLNSEQLFFIGFALPRCGHATLQARQMLLLGDPHSPETARVNTILGNYGDFATAFKCPIGSTMNPSHKCAVW